MKKRLVGISVLSLTLAVGLFVMSCAPAPQNANVAANQNQAKAQTQPTKPPEDDDPDAPECDATDLGTKKNNVQTRLNNSSVADLVKFEVRVVGTTHLEVYVENRPATGARRVPRNRTKMLDKELKKVMKGGCVSRVIFVAPGTLPLPPQITDQRTVEGFEWGCNDPDVLCPNGECLPQNQCGPGTVPTGTPPPSSNTNSNTTNSANNGTNR